MLLDGLGLCRSDSCGSRDFEKSLKPKTKVSACHVVGSEGLEPPTSSAADCTRKVQPLRHLRSDQLS